MTKGEISCKGRCDGLGDDNPHGSYVRLVYASADGTRHGIVISEGAAELLTAELQGALAQKEDAAVAAIMRDTRGV